MDAAQALGSCVLDDQLHQNPAQASAVKIRSQQDRILARLVDRVRVKSDDAEYLTIDFINGYKGPRLQVIKLR